MTRTERFLETIEDAANGETEGVSVLVVGTDVEADARTVAPWVAQRLYGRPFGRVLWSEPVEGGFEVVVADSAYRHPESAHWVGGGRA